jgi:hypothetical protein
MQREEVGGGIRVERLSLIPFVFDASIFHLKYISGDEVEQWSLFVIMARLVRVSLESLDQSPAGIHDYSSPISSQ